MIHDEGAENDLADGTVFLIGAHLSEASVRSPDTNNTISITGDHPGPILTESDDGESGLVQNLYEKRNMSLHVMVLTLSSRVIL